MVCLKTYTFGIKKNLPGYYEIFLDIPLQKLKQRDSKGIYKKFEIGKIRNVAGLDLEIQKPAKPNLHIKDNNHLNINKIINFVIKKNVLKFIIIPYLILIVKFSS